MDSAVYIFMTIFGVALLVYALMLSGGNHALLPAKAQISLQKKNRKAQVRRIAGIVARVGDVIVVFGLCGLLGGFLWGVIGAVLFLVLLIVLGAVYRQQKRELQREQRNAGRDR